MKTTIVESSVIYRCEDDDRYVIVIKSNEVVTGINFMQGDGLNNFKAYFCNPHKDLTKFYNATKNHLSGNCEIDRINQAIWAWFDYTNS